MRQPEERSVVWFKRDLRVVDHHVLHEASSRGPLIPLLIIEPELWQQPDASHRQYAFMRECALELNEELEEEKDKLSTDAVESVEELSGMLSENLKKINTHGKRASNIVKSMLMHAKQSSGSREGVDVNALMAETVRLAYHGLRAKSFDFNTGVKEEYDRSLAPVDMMPEDMRRVFLNIINNACYALHKKQKSAAPDYKPLLLVATKDRGSTVEVRIYDNGIGIPPDVTEKVFDPFFTTKPTGEGTGLGLSISRDIVVEGHQGELDMTTTPGEFTEFVITLPKKPGAPAATLVPKATPAPKATPDGEQSLPA